MTAKNGLKESARHLKGRASTVEQAALGARVAAQELVDRLGEVTVLDVRSPAEFAAMHIPGSFNLPLDRLPEYGSQLGSAVENPVVLVCRSGQRAQEAERALLGADLPGLHVLAGGLSAWENAGLPVVRGKERWSMERQVRGVAGALVLAGLAGSLVAPRLAFLAAGVGAGLLVSAITDTCTMARILAMLPYNKGTGCDVGQVIREMSEANRLAATGD